MATPTRIYRWQDRLIRAAHPSQVIELREARAAGETFTALAQRFGIHPSTAHAIASGETRAAALVRANYVEQAERIAA